MIYWSNRELVVHFVLRDFELEMQLIAIKGLLRHNREAEVASQREIDDLRERARQAAEPTKGMNYPYQDDEWVDRVFESFFHDAAHSMAAVGMLAPFFEALFAAIFRYVQDEMKQAGQASSEDQRRKAIKNNDSCPFSKFKRLKKQGIVKAIVETVDTTELAQFFPDDYQKTLEALFSYRNKMFHHGFLWPKDEKDEKDEIDEREKFRNRICENEWPGGWFQETTHNGDPYLFYMSDEFIEHCLKTIDDILDGVGAYYRSLHEDKWKKLISIIKNMPNTDFYNLTQTEEKK